MACPHRSATLGASTIARGSSTLARLSRGARVAACPRHRSGAFRCVRLWPATLGFCLGFGIRAFNRLSPLLRSRGGLLRRRLVSLIGRFLPSLFTVLRTPRILILAVVVA